jgi:hypothetical protein
MRERVARLEQVIMEAVKLASPALQQVINDLQALRGIADISTVTIAAELGQVSRFGSARELMGIAARCRAKIPAASESDVKASLKLGTRIFDESSAKQHLLRKSVKTIYRWANEGLIPSINLHGNVLFDLDLILAWIENYRMAA